VCRRQDALPVITARTPAFMSVMQSLTGSLDERSVVSRLADAWLPAPDDTTVVVDSATRPAWSMVFRSLNDGSGDYLAVLRLSDEFTVTDDAYFTMIENLPDVVARYDRDFRFLYVNPAIEEEKGIAAADHIGHDDREMAAPDYLVSQFFAAYQTVLDHGTAVEMEFECIGPRGLRHYLTLAMPERDYHGNVSSILSVVRDVSEVKRLQLQLEHWARTDALTGLLNRRGFFENAESHFDLALQGRCTLHFVLLDLDNFKQINDRFGHVTGDRVLQDAAAILREQVGPHDLVARLGGDEFCMALVDADTLHATSVAERVAALVEDIRNDEGQLMEVSASVGIAQACVEDTSVTQLITRVDALMYEAKSDRRRPEFTRPTNRLSAAE
jgi:diguanylate cyclase (GGDEF)-like protein/PAS domain S-box-containing protein